MAKTTVDYGIDLGTTNSAVARMTAKGCEVIPVQRQNYLPSVVARTKRGDLKVGLDAIRPDFTPLARQFKRLMGTSEQLELADGSKMDPASLSAEILKTLKAAVKLRTNEDLVDVVITVPAMFNQPQCEATIQAAKLAGLNAVTLLQEPIAAATAFLSDKPVEGNYLVYDLGGGTFDVSVVRLRSGEMHVLAHGGDNYLGGGDLDKVVHKWLLGQVLPSVPDATVLTSAKGNFELLKACEEARIDLSSQESATIYLDELDLPVSQLEFSRTQLETLIGDFVTRTIEVSRERLKVLGLDPSDVVSILLVGGPTQTPYVRDRLAKELGIPLNFDQDPMTVVALGAAMHASTLLVERSSETRVAADAISWTLHYDPVTNDPMPALAGTVHSPEGFAGEVRVQSSSGDFDTGWMTLINGSFATDLSLSQHDLSEFSISVRDLSGKALECDPAAITVRAGVRPAQPVVPYNVGVARKSGQIGVVVKAGQPLPAHGEEEFEVAETLLAGSAGKLVIHVVEGEGTHADEALEIVRLTIEGKDIPRSVKAGEKVKVLIRIDENRMIKGRIYVPLIDEEWELASKASIDEPDIDGVVLSLDNLRSKLRQIQDHVPESQHEELFRAEREIEKYEALVEEYEQGNRESIYQVQKQLQETQARIRPLAESYGNQALRDEISEFSDDAEAVCNEFEDNFGRAKVEDLRKDLDKAFRLGERSTMEAIRDRLREIFWEHYGKTRACAEYQVAWMREASSAASDRLSYHELLRKAEQALSDDDRQGVLLYASRAWDYLPSRERMKNRYHDAGVR